jgi:hypothetical protein
LALQTFVTATLHKAGPPRRASFNMSHAFDRAVIMPCHFPVSKTPASGSPSRLAMLADCSRTVLQFFLTCAGNLAGLTEKKRKRQSQR